MKRILVLPLLIAMLFVSTEFTNAQDASEEMQLSLQDGHEMKIDGTSNVRDWDADVKTINATFVVKPFDMDDLSSLSSDHFENLELSIPVEDIESDSGRLTKNMQKYLKEDDHPIITFRMDTIENIEVTGENEATITATGLLNVAGEDHETTMEVNASVNNGSITFAGTQQLKMTDFGIDPPTAVLGTIRARDEVDIIYSLTFSR